MKPPKLYAISDNPETLAGLALAGAQGQLAFTTEDLCRALENTPPGIDIVAITSTLAGNASDIIESHRSKNHKPMVAIIPEGSATDCVKTRP